MTHDSQLSTDVRYIYIVWYVNVHKRESIGKHNDTVWPGMVQLSSNF